MNDGTDTPGGEPIGELALDAVARHERRARARGFRYGTPRILRLDRQYWCDALGFRVDVTGPEPETEALRALVKAAQQVDPSGAPEPNVAVSLAILQATDAERRTWIVDADPAEGAETAPCRTADVAARPHPEPSRSEMRATGSSREVDAPRGSCGSGDPAPGGSARMRATSAAADTPRPVRGREGRTETRQQGSGARRDLGSARNVEEQARAAILGDFTAKVIDDNLKHHEVADVPTVASGFAHLDPVASFRGADTRTVVVELRTAIAMVEWSGATSRVWVAAGNAHSVRAALLRLRRQLGDVLRTSAGEDGGGLSVELGV